MALDDDGYHTLSVAEAYALPEREFRQLFCSVVIELTREVADIFTKRVDFLRDGRRIEDLTTKEMQEIVLSHQYWFRPKTARLAANEA
jgi:hypothetical protein